MASQNAQGPAPNTDSLLSPIAVAKMLGLSPRHVLRLPIRRLRIGYRTVRFRQSDVESFLDQRDEGQLSK